MHLTGNLEFMQIIRATQAGWKHHLDGLLGKADARHAVQCPLRLVAGDPLQAGKHLVQLAGAAHERGQQRLALLGVQLIRGVSFLCASKNPSSNFIPLA